VAAPAPALARSRASRRPSARRSGWTSRRRPSGNSTRSCSRARARSRACQAREPRLALDDHFGAVATGTPCGRSRATRRLPVADRADVGGACGGSHRRRARLGTCRGRIRRNANSGGKRRALTCRLSGGDRHSTGRTECASASDGRWTTVRYACSRSAGRLEGAWRALGIPGREGDRLTEEAAKDSQGGRATGRSCGRRLPGSAGCPAPRLRRARRRSSRRTRAVRSVGGPAAGARRGRPSGVVGRQPDLGGGVPALRAYCWPSASARPAGGDVMPSTERPLARRARRRVLPQPRPEAWSAALRPSQRRAAERRAAAAHERTVQRWLHDLARR
jgi:hypothetical protein